MYQLPCQWRCRHHYSKRRQQSCATMNIKAIYYDIIYMAEVKYTIYRLVKNLALICFIYFLLYMQNWTIVSHSVPLRTVKIVLGLVALVRLPFAKEKVPSILLWLYLPSLAGSKNTLGERLEFNSILSTYLHDPPRRFFMMPSQLMMRRVTYV